MWFEEQWKRQCDAMDDPDRIRRRAERDALRRAGDASRRQHERISNACVTRALDGGEPEASRRQQPEVAGGSNQTKAGRKEEKRERRLIKVQARLAAKAEASRKQQLEAAGAEAASCAQVRAKEKRRRLVRRRKAAAAKYGVEKAAVFAAEMMKK